MLGYLRYFYLKVLVTFSRALIRLLERPLRPRPDFVLQIASRDKRRTIKVHVYKPHATEARSSSPSPILINLYGSGFVIPLHGMDDDFCRFVADATGYVILDVNYCLAPEYPFPAALNDVEDTVEYVLDHPNEYDASQISISGFSSGGTLALSAASTSLPRGTFQSLIAFYPATNLHRDPSLRKALVPASKGRSSFWTRVFRESYLRGMDARDPRISPAFADMSNLPTKMLVITGELDQSATEAEELAETAKNEGHGTDREVIIRRMKGCGHAFDKKLTDEVCVAAKNETYGLVAEMLENVRK